MNRSLPLFVLLSIVFAALPRTLLAQVPQTFNYQGIARDANGNVLPNRVVGIQLSVLDGSPTGTVVYSETFTDTTNAFGLFTIRVGGGAVTSGTFTGINWASGNKYLQTGIDLTGGTNYTLSGTTALLSVPYALYAQTAVVGLTSGEWSLNGNAGTTAANFIGTTDTGAINFRWNNTEAGQIVGSNAFLGSGAGSVSAGTAVYDYSENTGIGQSALTSITGLGCCNVAVGASSMGNAVSGQANVAVGFRSLQTIDLASYNTGIGAFTDVSTDELTNATAIGYQTIVDASNKVRIGNTNVTAIEGQVPFTTPSDGRFKYNVRQDVRGLDFILRLRPVTYQLNTKKEEEFVSGKASSLPAAYHESMKIRRTGFIAQEVEKAAKRSGYDFDGLKIPKTDKEYYSLSYASFVVPLVKAVQEQQQMIRRQDQKIETQDRKIADLTEQLEELRRLILTASKH